MAFSVAQHAISSGNSAAGTSRSVSFPGAVTAGHTVVVMVSVGQAPPTGGVADNQTGNTYTRQQVGSQACSASARVAIWTCFNANSAGGTFTVTFTPTSSTFMCIEIVDISPSSGTVGVDLGGAGGTATATTTPTTASVTNTTTDGIAVAALSNLSNNNQTYTTTASGWSQLDYDGNGLSDQTGAFSYRVLSATGSQACTWSTGTDAGGYDSCILVLKVTAGGGTTYPLSGSASQTQTLTVARQPRLIRASTQAQSLSLVRGVALVRSVTQAQSLTLTRAAKFLRTVSLTQAQSLSIVAQKVFLRTVTATQAQTVSLAKQVRQTLSISQAQVLAFVKQVRLTRALTQAESASVVAIRPGITYTLSGSTSVHTTLSISAIKITLVQALWASALGSFQLAGYPQVYWDLLREFTMTAAGNAQVQWTGAGGQFKKGP